LSSRMARSRVVWPLLSLGFFGEPIGAVGKRPRAVGRIGAATRWNLGDNKGQQERRNVGVSGHLTATGLGCETAGVSFHCDDACGGCGWGLTRVFTGLVPLP
jgi:hypothetical protein